MKRKANCCVCFHAQQCLPFVCLSFERFSTSAAVQCNRRSCKTCFIGKARAALPRPPQRQVRRAFPYARLPSFKFDSSNLAISS
ncbi:hypothetical protein D6817_05335 [Candidatus Pacearchaeota archaeon]|nr:MAG: hypothetical protein D6817_05335 [Candidatus Pacearchaeota archaeon]